MNRWTFVNAIIAIVAAVPLVGQAVRAAQQIAGVPVPDTALANEATEIARSVEPPEIFNHSLRTYLFAELIAKAKNIEHDSEIVYVASLLHDTGLSTQYMSPQFPFEVDGANVARTLLSKHKVTTKRADLTWDAIALHDNGGIARHKQPEVMLVNAGVNADFGADLESMKRADVVAVLHAAPRTRFIDVFVNAAAAVAKRKPLSTAHSFVADIGYCKVPGFRLPSFCDGLNEDPFVDYHRP